MYIQLNSLKGSSIENLKKCLPYITPRIIDDICIFKKIKHVDEDDVYRAIQQIKEMLCNNIDEFFMRDNEVEALAEWIGNQSLVETNYLIQELDLDCLIMELERSLFDLYYHLSFMED